MKGDWTGLEFCNYSTRTGPTHQRAAGLTYHRCRRMFAAYTHTRIHTYSAISRARRFLTVPRRAKVSFPTQACLRTHTSPTAPHPRSLPLAHNRLPTQLPLAPLASPPYAPPVPSPLPPVPPLPHPAAPPAPACPSPVVLPVAALGCAAALLPPPGAPRARQAGGAAMVRHVAVQSQAGTPPLQCRRCRASFYARALAATPPA